jgi:hypothetical protein
MLDIKDDNDLTNDEHYYAYGACHIFAIAAQRLKGGSFLVIEDHEEYFWGSDEDPDDYIPAVLHVFAVWDTSEGQVAVDIFGQRPLEDALAEAQERFRVPHATDDTIPNESLLIEMYVDTEEDADRPLTSFSESDIEDAMKILTARYEAEPVGELGHSL